jgi:antitoxin VapB
MQTTRVFKSGDGQAVRIPADMAYDDPSQEVTIARQGDVITIAPVQPDAQPRLSLQEMVALLRSMPKPDTVELMDRTEMFDREPD